MVTRQMALRHWPSAHVADMHVVTWQKCGSRCIQPPGKIVARVLAKTKTNFSGANGDCFDASKGAFGVFIFFYWAKLTDGGEWVFNIL